MKKLLCSLMVALIAFSGCAALAAGKLEVTHENLMLLDEYGFEGYAFARVENTGDKPIKINAGVMELYNADGDAITSSDYLYAYGSEQLNPGEYTYVQLSASDSEVEVWTVLDVFLQGIILLQITILRFLIRTYGLEILVEVVCTRGQKHGPECRY